MEDDPLLTVREVARRLRVSETTIRRQIASGQIRASKPISRGWRIRQSEYDRITLRSEISGHKKILPSEPEGPDG